MKIGFIVNGVCIMDKISEQYVRDYLRNLVEKHGLLNKAIESSSEYSGGYEISSHIVPPEWFRLPSSEYAIMRGREYMMECRLGGVKAHVFTPKPYTGETSVGEILSLKLDRIVNRSIFYCGLNVILRYLGLIDKTIHCRGNEPIYCAEKMIDKLYSLHGDKKLLIIGYQPAIVEKAVEKFSYVEVVDMDPVNIGKKVGDTIIRDAVEEVKLIRKADIVLATGSSIINSSFWNIYSEARDRYLYLYGVSGAGIAYVLGIPRLCYYGK